MAEKKNNIKSSHARFSGAPWYGHFNEIVTGGVS